MRTNLFALLLAATALPAGTVHAQAIVVGGDTAPVLRSGTEIPVRTRTELTTEHKGLRVGDRFEVETSEPVLLRGQTIIPVGTPGIGEITMVRNKGMWGKAGHFAVRLLYLSVGDRQIRIRGTIDDKGSAGGAGAVAVSALVFLPAGFFMTGKSARLPAGTIIPAFLEEDVPVVFAGDAAPQPATVPPPAALIPTNGTAGPTSTGRPVTSAPQANGANPK